MCNYSEWILGYNQSQVNCATGYMQIQAKSNVKHQQANLWLALSTMEREHGFAHPVLLSLPTSQLHMWSFIREAKWNGYCGAINNIMHAFVKANYHQACSDPVLSYSSNLCNCFFKGKHKDSPPHFQDAEIVWKSKICDTSWTEIVGRQMLGTK